MSRPGEDGGNPRGGGILAFGVQRPVGTLMVVLAAMVFGLVSLRRLPVDLLPEVDYPSLTVRTSYPGAAPQDLEERVTERLEDALATVRGLVRMRSSSRAEVSEILLEFEWGSKLSFLVQDVRERLDRVFLPEGVERPLILRYDPGLDPVLRVALSGDRDLIRLRDLAEQEVERELEGLPGVAAVRVRGGLEDEIQVRVDPARLAHYRIGTELIRQRLAEENLNVPGGTVEEGAVEYVVRTLNEFRSLQEIAELPVVVRSGTPILLEDLAEVAWAHKDRDVILRVDGREAVEIDVFREAGANLTEVARVVRERLFGTPEQQRALARLEREGNPPPRDEKEALERERMEDFLARKLPPDLKLTVLSDQSRFVEGAIREVGEAGLVGGALAILVCFLFLRSLGVTLVVALSIPISVLATFGPMFLGGVTLNVMSLGGLALGIGMLVDNTIVVLESITRCREEGDGRVEAALRGVREVGSAVTASTLTTIAVFAPIVFVEGLAGQIFGDQSLTVVCSLLVSLAVALFFLPGIAARLELLRSERGDLGTRLRREWRAVRTDLAGPRHWFRGLPRPRRWKTWALLALAGAALAAWCHGQLTQLEAPWKEKPLEARPPELKEALAWYAFGRTAGALPALWLLGEPLLVLAGRILGDAVAFAATALRWGLGLLLAPALLVLAIPGLVVAGLQRFLDRAYPWFLRGALHAPLLVLLAAGALSALAWRTLPGLGRELLPEVRQGEFTAEIYFPAGSPLEETDRLASRLERRIAAFDGVAASAVVSGMDREEVSQEEDGPHVARILVQLDPGPEMRKVEERVEAEVRHLLEAQPEIARYDIERPTLLALTAPLEIEILGRDLAEIEEVARRVEAAVSGVEGIVDLRSSIRRGNPEVRIVLDRQRLAEHGLTLAEVARNLRQAVEGEIGSTFPQDDERLDIRVRADLSHLSHVMQLRDLPVNPEAEKPLPLEAVAELSIADGPGEIRHIGQRRAAVLTASTEGFDLGDLTDRLERRLASVPRPPDTTVQVGGQKREMELALSSLGFALALAVFLVYAVMAAQFESLLQPFLILFSVPLAFLGVVFALAWTGTPVSVVVLLGAVMLAGIVVNNAIVLVDRINRNRARGQVLDEAIVEAGRARLRPILMTTVTTVLGMLPLTGWLAGLPGLGDLGTAEGTELRAPMALVVIAGLISSTLLTLVVIPVLYRLLARIGGRWEPLA